MTLESHINTSPLLDNNDFTELHSVILNFVNSSAQRREKVTSTNYRVDQRLIWRCMSAYERPNRRASAKNLRESAIGVRKT